MASDKEIISDSHLRDLHGFLEINNEIPAHTSSRCTLGSCGGSRFMLSLNFIYSSNLLKSPVSDVSALAS